MRQKAWRGHRGLKTLATLSAYVLSWILGFHALLLVLVDAGTHYRFWGTPTSVADHWLLANLEEGPLSFATGEEGFGLSFLEYEREGQKISFKTNDPTLRSQSTAPNHEEASADAPSIGEAENPSDQTRSVIWEADPQWTLAHLPAHYNYIVLEGRTHRVPDLTHNYLIPRTAWEQDPYLKNLAQKLQQTEFFSWSAVALKPDDLKKQVLNFTAYEQALTGDLALLRQMTNAAGYPSQEAISRVDDRLIRFFVSLHRSYFIWVTVVAACLWLLAVGLRVYMAGWIKPVRFKATQAPTTKESIEKSYAVFRLTLLEKIPTDLFYAALFFLFVLGALGSGGTVEYGVVVATLMFLLGYLSLTSASRRIQAHCFWSSCLIYRIPKAMLTFLRTTLRGIQRDSLNQFWILFWTVDALLIAGLFGGGWPLIALLVGGVSWVLLLLIGRDFSGLKRHLDEIPVQQDPLTETVKTDEVRNRFSFASAREADRQLTALETALSAQQIKQTAAQRHKNELITNFSHDLRTPLTALVQATYLLEAQPDGTDAADQQMLVAEIRRQAARLETLQEGLILLTQATSNDLPVEVEPLDLQLFMVQMFEAFDERLNSAQLTLVYRAPGQTVPLVWGVQPQQETGLEDPATERTDTANLAADENPLKTLNAASAVVVQTDPNHLHRIVDNLMENICKYALRHSVVYVTLYCENDQVHVRLINTLAKPLLVEEKQLFERLVRGESDRHQAGHGLGLAIARSLTEAIGGVIALRCQEGCFEVELSLPQTTGPEQG